MGTIWPRINAKDANQDIKYFFRFVFIRVYSRLGFVLFGTRALRRQGSLPFGKLRVGITEKGSVLM
jgi:hypothetical protein